MSSITGDVTELNNINTEIKRLALQLKHLRKKAEECKGRICNYMKENEQPGVRYKNQAILLETKKKNAVKKKAELETDTIEILRKHGVVNAAKALEEIKKAKKGESLDFETVKITEIKQ